ncbi:RNA polymerase sigma factor [Nakamurella lactea]|uniref:RNA polymerase sigma factor n=1 Tax=Nakamurella lactea TaxID=459515 RepID=UPI00068904BA|nr:RNA polymerase sigma factor [Nakamurella lactea]
MTDPEGVRAAIADAHRRVWALVLAATVRVAGDLGLAEECVQEAYSSALTSWARDGIPKNPAAWLTTTARRRAVDAIRRERALRAKLPLLVEPTESVEDSAMDERSSANEDPQAAIPDDRLRLIFTCCHPALPQDGQIALTLRLMCGISTPDIARAFLVPEATMAARITRAKRKIAGARIPYRIPHTAELPDRLRAVLGVIHLLFSTGHTAPSGADLLRTDLVERALQLARTLGDLMPDEPEVRGLLALLLVTDARRATRVDAAGRLVRLQDQDRSRWDRTAIAEAHDLIVAGLRNDRPGRYLLQAAIASLYAQAPSYEQTDWSQIVAMYDALLVVWPSPVVALNRAVPLAMVAGPQTALVEIERIEQDGSLPAYQYLPAVKGDLLSRLGRDHEAAIAYRQALQLTTNGAERAFLAGRLAATAEVTATPTDADPGTSAPPGSR